MDRALGIIPARAGSKGLPNKHFLTLGGQTLIERAIRSAQASTLLTRTIVSTDSPEIAGEAARHGAEVPFIRPALLATDEAGMIPVLQHAVTAVGGDYDLIVLLQPTSPFRTGEDIDECIALVTGDIYSAQTVIEAYNPGKMMYRSEAGWAIFEDFIVMIDDSRRQTTRAYQPSGSVYVVRREVLMNHNRIIDFGHMPLIRPWERSININTLWDFRIAEMVHENRHLG